MLFLYVFLNEVKHVIQQEHADLRNAIHRFEVFDPIYASFHSEVN